MRGQPDVLHGKNFNVGHYKQTVQPNFIIPATLVGTIDFYHFTLLSLTVTLHGEHTVSTTQIYWPHFLPHFFI